ncbi:18760_t:CDS:2, partial [Racocetra fulgida]
LVTTYFKENSLRKTANIFHMKYPNKSKPNPSTIYNLVNKFIKTDSVADYYHSSHPIKLNNIDPNSRLEFCNILILLITNNETFISRICFTDEAVFYLNIKINVWAGIVDNFIIRLFFFEENLNSSKYLELLQNNIIPELDNLFSEGHRKTEVFKMSPNNIEDLKQRIVNEYENITFKQLSNVRHMFIIRLKYCAEVN